MCKVARGYLLLVLGYLSLASSIYGQQSTWTLYTPSGFGPRGGGGAQSTAYDVATDRLIVFGGYDPTANPCCGETNDVWVLVNASGTGGLPAWQKETVIPDATQGVPQPREVHSAVYDPATNRLIIFGGGQVGGGAFSALFQDTWVLTYANNLGGTPQWILLTPSGGPPAPREGHAAFYNQATNEMFVFGGGNNGIMSVPNDLWVLENANGVASPTWIQLSEAGNVPGRLENFASAYDQADNLWTVVGGCCGYTNASQVVALNQPGGTPQWMSLSPTGTLPPSGDALVYGYDPASNRLIVHGILPGGGSNATWLLTNANGVGATPAWVNLIPEGAAGSPPEGVNRVGSAYNPITKKLIHAVTLFDAQGNLVPEVWVLGNADGSTPLGQQAAERAKTLLGRPYFLGAKGFDYSSSPNQYVDADAISSGYGHCDGSPACVDGTQASHAPGIDCSGLILWSYNTAAGASTQYLDSNPIKYEGAGAQCSNPQSLSLTVNNLSDLNPGDILCFKYHFADGTTDSHVAMHVGQGEVVEAYLPRTGVVSSSLVPDGQGRTRANYDSQASWPVCGNGTNTKCFDFLGYRRPLQAQVGIAFFTHSPVTLGVLDPEGFSIDTRTSILTDRESLREVPGQLYYVEDSNSDDTVIAPMLKVGDYSVKVMAKTNASPTDTYSLTVTTNASTVTLAQNVPINEIPTLGYGISSNGTSLTSFTPIPINIQPRMKDPARIELDLDSDETIAVAILPTTNFEPLSQVDASSLTFGETGTEPSFAYCKRQTKDNDSPSQSSLVCHFYLRKTAFRVGDTQGVLKGLMIDGQVIQGKDSIRIVSEEEDD